MRVRVTDLHRLEPGETRAIRPRRVRGQRAGKSLQGTDKRRIVRDPHTRRKADW